MTDKPLDDVWTTRDLPVLAEVTRRIDGGAKGPSVAGVASTLDMDKKQVVLAGAALVRRSLVNMSNDLFLDVSAEAYFLTGLHPSGDDAVTSLVSALRQAADLVDDLDEKSRLGRLADGFLGLPGSVAGGVITAVINQQLGV